MLFFANDYAEGAHGAVLRRLCETNFDQLPGYGLDPVCDGAKAKIREAVGDPDADVFFLVGGTQTNQIVIDTMLAAYEGVVSADTGHVNGHEAGAIEYTGHKVLTIPHEMGRIPADALDAYLAAYFADETCEHMVRPGMVYISHPTEYGTLYSLAELTALSEVCRRYGLPLIMDGARMGYGLMSGGTDVTLADIARLCDAFYIGGTKVGALCGEAVVFPRHGAPRHFFSSIKQHGALLAKGRLLGLQFDALFTDGLYFEISRHAIDMADRLRAILREKGYAFHIETVTNQIFVVMDNARLETIRPQVALSVWEKPDAGHTVVRFATSWATRPESVEALQDIL